ncbi:neopullulanase SusA [Persicobacter diffluens]|uniref:Neopullulanase SusA n=2 Tax=Persicobacter diffluens TaxID=981 RepID=A0AAN5ANN9_9BACT|nr:neopullulanase SusA [Persicobacter diffluens]
MTVVSFAEAAKVKVDRVEPLNWWVGMKNPALQLMIHGENIADLNPTINYAGVSLDRVIKVENPNYLFVDLTIGKEAQAGTFNIEFKKGGKVQLKYPYELKKREANSANRQGFDASDVIYLITPDRFANGDPSNDTVEGYADGLNREDKMGRHGGDIQGMIDHLDYVEDMGFTAIWPQPLVENDQEHMSYHGYSITDFYHIDPRFGSNELYREFSDKAAEKGIKIVMDMVFNHCGSGHWWMGDFPTNDWINYQAEGFKPTNHKRTSIQDPHGAQVDLQGMTDGWFVETMPDLNQRNPLLAEYLIQNSIWWVEYANLGGIRMDTYPYPDADFMADWTCRVMAEYPNFNIVGEEWSISPAIVAFWQRDKVNINGYSSCLPSLMDFPIQDAVVKSLNKEESFHWSDYWNDMYEMLAHDFLYAHPEDLTIFPDNHDMSRFYSQVNENFDHFKLGITYFLTTRGIPQIYYGTELLMKGVEDHGIIRSDFPGGWEGDAINAFEGKGLSADQAEATAFMKTLLNWRKNSEAVAKGKIKHFAPEDGVYVYFRYTEEAQVMVVLNKNAEAKTLSSARFAEILKADATGKELFSGKNMNFSGDFEVPAKGYLVVDIQ